MLTLEKCRELLGEAGRDLPDGEVAALRELAGVVVEMFIHKVQAEKGNVSRKSEVDNNLLGKGY
jgi:hypothetical protein